MAIVLICFGIVVRLFDRAVLQNGLAETKALAQQSVVQTVNPFRGVIYAQGANDNDPVPIALNEPKARIDIIPKNVKDHALVAKTLAPMLGMDEKELDGLINNDKPYIPPVKRNLPLSVGQHIEDLHIVGVSVVSESYRAYPEGSLAAQVLGFVNGDSEGQYGIEQRYNSLLQGFTTNVTGQRDGWGNTFIDTTDVTKNKGADVVLTIDRDVQVTVEQMLQDAVKKFSAKSGSVTIVDPKTGRVIAMATAPTFDPNSYNQVKPEDQSVYKNAAVSRTLEPGSVMKSITIASGLDSGRIKATDEGNYGASVKVNDREIHTAQNKAFGHETVTDVLVNSDNVAMVDISGKLGRELEYDYMQRFNFSKKTGIDLDNEATGSMPPLKDWRAVNTATIAFGQGITITPLQMTMAYAAIANKGVYMKPYLVDSIHFPDGKKEDTTAQQVGRAVGEDAASQVTQMLIEVVTRGHGKKAGVAGYTVAGKTGTAQIANLDGSGYVDGKNNGSFAGFAPVEDPKFAMFVTLEEPQGVDFAESSAAPLWGQIAQYLLKNRYHIAPKQ